MYRSRSAVLCAALSVALVAVACGDPEIPISRSDTTPLVTATALPAPPTPEPTVTPTPTPTPDSGLAPVPTVAPVRQPGLYEDRVRVAVVADVDTGGTADDLFRDAWLGTLAWQASVNDAGGLAGRDVEVQLFDSNLFNHRIVLEQICRGDFFAIVGSQSLGDSQGAELLGTEDCDIADFPGAVHGARRAASPVTFLSNPFLNDVRQAGPARYLVEAFPEASQNLILFYYDELELSDETERIREMLVGAGMNVVFELPTTFEEGPSERVLARWEEVGAESLVWTSDPGQLIELLEALPEPPVFVLCELGCYSQEFLIEGGDAVEGVYTWIAHSPFGARNERGDLLDYRYWLEQTEPEAGWSTIGHQSWMAGRLFENAFLRLLGVQPDFPERSELAAAARTITDFTAEGVLPFTDPGPGNPTPCFALMVVRNGEWVQEHPRPPRDQDCSEDNVFELVGTRGLGLTSISATTSELPAPTPDPEVPDLENPENAPG